MAKNMRDQEIKINIGTLKTDVLPRRVSTTKAEWVGSSEKGKDNIDVFIEKDALNKALADGRTRGLRNEVGGTLVGRRFLDSTTGKPCTEIVDYLPGEDVIQKGAAVTFTADTWSKAIKRTEVLAAQANDPTLVPIGWFHTHPNFGIFLSGDDRAIQDNFFDQPGQLAVVFDPVRNQLGIFSSGGTGDQYGSVRRHSGYFLCEEEDKIPVQINLSPQISESDRTKEERERAKSVLLGFVRAQEVTKESASIFEAVQNGGLTDDVLRFVAGQAQKQIAELSRLEDPGQRQAAIEKARHLKDVTLAYKLIKEHR